MPPRLSSHALLMLVLSFGVAGCDSDNTYPNGSIRRDIEGTSMVVSNVKQPLVIEGCSVTIHRIHTAPGDMLNDFTVGVAKCPTATVTSTSHTCGKGCTANNIMVNPSTE